MLSYVVVCGMFANRDRRHLFIFPPSIKPRSTLKTNSTFPKAVKFLASGKRWRLVEMNSVAMLFCLALLALVECVSAASTCPPCDFSRCLPLHVPSCMAGAEADRCRCCLICSQAENEPCGETFGNCGRHLKCDSSSGRGVCVPNTWFSLPSTSTVPPTPSTTEKAQPTTEERLPVTDELIKDASSAMSTTSNTATSTPKPVEPEPVLTGDTVSIQSLEVEVEEENSPDKCPSPCSLEYCSDNRNKMCSVNTSEILGDDYEFDKESNCHVTSCNACFFVEDFNPPCLCSHPRCLLSYGQCMKAYVRRVKVKPLGKVTQTHKGKILCKVPVS